MILAFGTIVQHSGGYPGYGSQMRWHPATGLGTVVLANSTYAHAGALAGELLSALLTAQATQDTERGRYRLRGPFPGGRPWPETLAARDTRSTICSLTGPTTSPRASSPRTSTWTGRSRSARRRSQLLRERDRRVRRRPRPARRVRFARALPLVADRSGRHGDGADQAVAPAATARAAAPIAVPPARGSALRRGAGPARRARSAQRSPAWPAGLTSADGFDAGRAAAPAAHGGRVGRPGCHRLLPGRERQHQRDRAAGRSRPGRSGWPWRSPSQASSSGPRSPSRARQPPHSGCCAGQAPSLRPVSWLARG